MRRLFLMLLFVCFSEPALCKAPVLAYQVDVIVFMHELNMGTNAVSKRDPTDPFSSGLSFIFKNAQPPEHYLSPSQSYLLKAYQQLYRIYPVLLHLSFIQQASQTKPILLPHMQQGDWQAQGTLEIRHANLYQMKLNLLLSNPMNEADIAFIHRRRLKPEQTYYIDHPQAGLVISIHPLKD